MSDDTQKEVKTESVIVMPIQGETNDNNSLKTITLNITATNLSNVCNAAAINLT